ncbi:MAG: hypothetical protein BWY51_00741 [Parcubacteria group bacterium ADurb.Bin316]|nr:MAG: hypothetical protein BWY51_00741 [Parcubacteria group bacterium ADurb.Bin316]
MNNKSSSEKNVLSIVGRTFFAGVVGSAPCSSRRVELETDLLEKFFIYYLNR